MTDIGNYCKHHDFFGPLKKLGKYYKLRFSKETQGTLIKSCCIEVFSLKELVLVEDEPAG